MFVIIKRMLCLFAIFALLSGEFHLHLFLPLDAKSRADLSRLRNAGQVKRQDALVEKFNFHSYPPMLYPVRIGIASRAAVVHFAVPSNGAVFVDDHPVFSLKPLVPYLIMGGCVLELGSKRSYRLPADRRATVAAAQETLMPDGRRHLSYQVWINNRWYRGVAELINFGVRVTAINVLDLEEYLHGVVPAEMPSSWRMEALKAQAVAARSYAWAHLGRGSKWAASEGYDLVPDVRDQAYKGLAVEARSTYWAVQQTRGIILKNAGRVKPGFYRAWVGDAFENLNIRKQAVLSSYLEKITGVPAIVGVTVKQWDATGNARDIQVIGQKKSREVYGVALARMLGFSTAGILDVQPDGKHWIFTYRGPGNGARGLSQHGANMLAGRGWRFDQILTQYYQDPDGKLHLDFLDYYRPHLPYLSVYRQAAAQGEAAHLSACGHETSGSDEAAKMPEDE